MLKPFMTEVYTKLCKLNRTQVQGYISTCQYCLIARGLSSFYILVELFLLNLCFQCLTEFLKIRTCFEYCRLKQGIMLKGSKWTILAYQVLKI